MDNLPTKIANLELLRKFGFDVPEFLVLEIESEKEFVREIQKCRDFFGKIGVENVILRSAADLEDDKGISRAGFFESSEKIGLDDLNEEKIAKLWQENLEKLREAGGQKFTMFAQAFFESELSGVFFTSGQYRAWEAQLFLSAQNFAITDGKDAEKKVIFDKEEGSWHGDELPQDIKKQLEKMITWSDEFFPNGADIELGISEEKVFFFQIRPVTRSLDAEILYAEAARLRKIFGTDFAAQEWEQNYFTEALGEISEQSMEFYNDLLSGQDFQRILVEAGIAKTVKDQEVLRILETIGGKIFYNATEAQKIFSEPKSKWGNFWRMVLLMANEKMERQNLKKIAEKDNSAEETFAYFFLAGFWVNLFKRQARNKYAEIEFFKRLKNSEIFCGALEPRPVSLENKDLERFKKEFSYLADNPYEIGARRYADFSLDELTQKYRDFFGKIPEIVSEKEILDEKFCFWLGQKVLWRRKFLQALAKDKDELLQRYAPKAQPQEKVEKLTQNYIQISGANFPFCKAKKTGEVVISPGEIDLENIVRLNGDEDIAEYFGQTIFVPSFPANWIGHILKLKGIVLAQGNELSHMAIVCRENNVPCIIIQS